MYKRNKYMFKRVTKTARSHNSGIMQSFPPPAFLIMPAVGVDVSDKSIKFLQFERTRAGCKLSVFGDVDLKEGVVVDGEIKDSKLLIEALKVVKERSNANFARASLPEQKAYFFTTKIPADASHEQIMKILEFELEEHVPLSPGEAIVDYDRVIGDIEEKEIGVGVTVYPRATVTKYTDAFIQAGLFPLSLEIEAHATERSIIPKGDLGTMMAIDLGETGTGLSIVSKGMLAFTSTLDMAGATLTKIFVEELSLAEGDVAHAKNTIGITINEEHAILTKKLLSVVDILVEEIKRHRVYWETHEGEGGTKNSLIDEVLLCGGNANIKGLPEYIEHALAIPTRRANVWQNAFSIEEVVPHMSYEVSLSYSTAVGLALRNDN